MKTRSKHILVAGVAFATLLTVGCNSKPDPGEDNPPATTGASTSAPSTAPTTAAAPAAVGTPTVAIAPDAGFDAAKSEAGFKEVKAIGKSPVSGDKSATEKGAALFAQNCASCHGTAGAGDGPAGMALNPPPRNLTHSKEYKYGAGELGIFRTGKYGIKGTGMAGWEGRMTDEQTWQVANYIRTLQVD